MTQWFILVYSCQNFMSKLRSFSTNRSLFLFTFIYFNLIKLTRIIFMFFSLSDKIYHVFITVIWISPKFSTVLNLGNETYMLLCCIEIKSWNSTTSDKMKINLPKCWFINVVCSTYFFFLFFFYLQNLLFSCFKFHRCCVMSLVWDDIVKNFKSFAYSKSQWGLI